jgi:nucleotide-binding universal stress UspA family protein
VNHNFLISVDGSEASHLAYEVITSSLLNLSGRHDFLTVGHVFNKNKSYLPFNMQAESIRQTYEALITGYGSRAYLMWEELDPRFTTKEHVVDMTRRTGADILVVGMHGRKGPKADPTILGSAVQYMSINTSIPLLIIKDRTFR